MSNNKQNQIIHSQFRLRQQNSAKTLPQSHKQEHISFGQIIKSIIYGGLDGCINVLVIMLSSIAYGQSAQSVLTFSLAAIVGDGISMGFGDYLSALAQIKYIKHQQQRQFYQVQNFIQDQIKQIIDLYQQKGYSQIDAIRIAELYSTNHQAFVNIMMLEQLGLVTIQQEVALKCGIATIISFMLLGLIPVIPYIISSGIKKNQQHNTIAVIVIGAFQLFSLGFSKAKIIGINVWISGLQSLILGAAATAIGYGIGLAIPQ